MEMEANTICKWFYRFGDKRKVTYEKYLDYAAARLGINKDNINDLQFPELQLRILYKDCLKDVAGIDVLEVTKKETHDEDIDIINLPLQTAKNITSIAINFDWETAFKIEKMLGNIKDDEFAFDEFKSQIMDDVFNFVYDCVKNNHNNYFMEFVHSMRLEYRDGTVTLRYQPVVWDNYD